MNQARFADAFLKAAWSAASTGAGGFSAVLDTVGGPYVTAFGTTSGASTLTLQVSHDGVTFYDTAHTVAANGSFSLTVTTAARFIRLKSGSDVTATVWLSAK